MQFLHKQLNLNLGDVVRVDIDRAANVRLLDSMNFSKYRNGQSCNGYGGLSTSTPVRIPAPRTGTWHVVIDLGPGGGHIKHSIRIER